MTLFGLIGAICGLSSLACSRSHNAAGSSSSNGVVANSVVQLAAGKDTTCARMTTDDVMCWGDDAFTSGTMTASDLPPPTRMRPVKVAGTHGATSMDVAASLGCVVDPNASLLCWSDGAADSLLPASQLYASDVNVRNVTDVSLSVASSPRICVRKKDRTMSCLTADREAMPKDEEAVTGLSNVEAISVGDVITCAIHDSGKLACWGGAYVGLLSKEKTLAAPPQMEGAREVSAGSAAACAIDVARNIACFGSTSSFRNPPSGPAAHVRVGVSHACAIEMDGHVVCWGDNRFGQLGMRATNGAWVAGIEDAMDVAVGEWHTCALEKSGRVACWGRNARGQLGDGTSVDRKAPTAVTFAE